MRDWHQTVLRDAQPVVAPDPLRRAPPAYVRIAYARWPVASAGGDVAPVWLSPVAYGVALLAGVLAMLVLVKRDWVARGLLVLYVLAMPFFVWAAGLWVACRHGDCI